MFRKCNRRRIVRNVFRGAQCAHLVRNCPNTNFERFQYVTLELRAQSASLDRLDTVRIRDAGRNVAADDRGGNINLPIDLPSLNLMSVETTLVVPALPSLKRVTGQDFGRDLARWKAWIAAQPDFKKE